jgi:hypothetical protein
MLPPTFLEGIMAVFGQFIQYEFLFRYAGIQFRHAGRSFR